MIRVGYGNLEVVGSKVEIMADIATVLHALEEKGTLTWNDIDAIVEYAKKSNEELEANYKESIKESKKELLKTLSELLDDIISESE